MRLSSYIKQIPGQSIENLMSQKAITDAIAASATSNLNGTSYLMVYGVGTPTENAAELQAAYDAAKNMPRYLGEFTFTDSISIYKGQTLKVIGPNVYIKALTDTSISISNLIGDSNLRTIIPTEVEAKSVRTTIIVAPGDYKFNNQLVLNLSNVNVISLTGYCDVFISGIRVSGNNSTIRGIDTGNFSFNVVSGPIIKIDNCKGFGLVETFTNNLSGANNYTVIAEDVEKYVGIGFDLSGIEVSNLIFGGKILNKARFRNGSFINCVFEDANLSESDLQNCNFTGCGMLNTNFSPAPLINGANFTGVTGLDALIGNAFLPSEFLVNTIITWTDGMLYSNNGIAWINLGNSSS